MMTSRALKKHLQKTLSIEAYKEFFNTREFKRLMFLSSETKEERGYWLKKLNEDVKQRNVAAWQLAVQISHDAGCGEPEAEQMMVDACNVPPSWIWFFDCPRCGQLPSKANATECAWCETELGVVAQEMRKAKL